MILRKSGISRTLNLVSRGELYDSHFISLTDKTEGQVWETDLVASHNMYSLCFKML